MSIKAETSFSLKDQLFNAKTLGVLSERLNDAYPGFKRNKFEREVLARFPELELKERISWIVTTLEAHLPGEFPLAMDILHRALPTPLDPSKSDDDFGHFIWAVPGEYVSRHGCTIEHLAASLDFLREATMRFTSEGAIRPFLRRYRAQTMAFVHECAKHGNYHVRRLASEGIRPFLPWAPRAGVPVDQVISVLDCLYADNTRFVTRSVANTLNDVSRIDAELVIHTLKRWHKQHYQQTEELAWITRHALRTLVKQDHPAALELLGYPTEPRFRISNIEASEIVKVGTHLSWRCQLVSLAEQRLKIMLRINFLKANGSHSVKVFAVKDARLDKGEQLQINKQLLFKPMTTRVLYPGTHYVELVVNGVARGKRAFELVV